MKRISVLAVGSLLVGLVGTASTPTLLAQAGAGWTVLFDGKSLDSWTPVGDANWRVMNGIVEANMGAGFLVSKQSYVDFEIRTDVWVTPEANSGVFIRCQDAAKIAATTCYEVNVYDQRPDQTYRTGGIVDVAKPMAMMNAGNQWTTLEITAKGPRLMVRMNGMQMVDVEDKKFARGPFALQAGAGTVRFRNVQIRELK